MTQVHVNAPLILFVDDEETAVKYFQRAIGALAPVITAGSVADGKLMLDQYADSLAVLVSDQRMPGGYGNELLHYARDRYPHMVRILTTAYSELEQTIEAVNQGQIHRYIQKPWDITVLRMELKQSLDLASLRKEHGGLLQEKLEVRQKQLVSGRIGTLQTLCIGLLGRGHDVPLETYLGAAHKVGVTSPVPNWAQLDYFDLVSIEAARSGEFAHALNKQLSHMQQRYGNLPPEQALAVLFEVLPGKVAPGSSGSPGGAILLEPHNLSEFLAAPIAAPVSAEHINWLAYLLWLDGICATLQISRSELGLQCRIIEADMAAPPLRLAGWIEQF
jgi:two-component system probable response regulator PhcQ